MILFKRMINGHDTVTVVGTVVISATAFAATNIDDLLLLTMFFSQSGRGVTRGSVVAGQFLGFSVLVGISLAGFFGRHALPGAWAGLLGLVPIVIGVRHWIRRNAPVAPPQSSSMSVAGVAAVIFASGGDNIGVYAPMFAASDGLRLTVTLATFYLLLAIWCFIGHAISNHPALGPVFARRGHVVMPFVLVGIGIYIVVSKGMPAFPGL